MNIGSVVATQSLVVWEPKLKVTVNAGRKRKFVVAIIGIMPDDEVSAFDIEKRMNELGWVKKGK